MNKYDHLPLTPFEGEVQRQVRRGGGGYKLPAGRQKSHFSQEIGHKADEVITSFNSVKSKYSGIIHPSLIFEIEINQSVDFNTIEQTLGSMGIYVLSSAENKKGYWVVFSDDETLREFKRKLATYGSEEGPKYDFFNAIETIRDIPKEEKMGEKLKNQPLGNTPEFIDLELWRMIDEEKNKNFINELKEAEAIAKSADPTYTEE